MLTRVSALAVALSLTCLGSTGFGAVITFTSTLQSPAFPMGPGVPGQTRTNYSEAVDLDRNGTSDVRFSATRVSLNGNPGVRFEYYIDAQAVSSSGWKKSTVLIPISVQVGPSTTWSTGGSDYLYRIWTSLFSATTDGYIGFTLSSAGGSHYGWMHLARTGPTGGLAANAHTARMTLLGWGYETVPGRPITVGAPATLPGDFNLDGQVDAGDYTVWADHFGTAYPDADPNRDGVVNAADYTVWADNFGAADPSLAAIPEPAGSPLMFGTTVLLGRRRR